MKSLPQDKWLDNSSENLGVLHKTSDSTMLLAMQSGEFSKEDLWFLKDDEGEEYVVFPQKLFLQLIRHIKHIQEEKLMMNLEKDVISQMPIDFDDAMAVAKNALESLRRSDGNLPEINTANLAKNIKKEYPNLFFDIDFLRKSK
ncbi:DUF2603 domain-containing protein [Helicobacter typhlonius]|uniref:DUF2603 domain-containing protein n=1 Tax=Helicobacter typhlonius TaxID=76936 RepID=UPI002FE09A61